ncbi:MAG: glycosyltransferase family 4 protein [Pseudolysinimonas sp.]
MKLGMLSQWFDPEPGPAAIPGVLAREFVRQGHEVSVLTGFPNYPEGRIHEGYRQRPRSRTTVDGISVTRVPLYASHSASALGRALNYGTFAMSATLFGRPALRDVDAVWVYNSPVTVALPMSALTRRGQIPIFLQVQDLWPDSLLESGMLARGVASRAIAKGIARVVRAMENRATIIGVSSRSARDLILERNPRLDPTRVVYSPNPVDESLFAAVQHGDDLPDAPWAERFTVMYVGAVGEVQGLDTLISAAEALRSRTDIGFVIVGDGIARERLEARARELDNMTFVGRVPMSRVPGYLARSDVQLVSLADRPFLRHTTPSKIASLLASGVPMIGQLAGDGARLILDADAGVVAEPGDVESLVQAITSMAGASPDRLTAYAEAGKRYYGAHLSAEVVASAVVEALGR